MEADFSGYATKAGLKCSDGRTIMPDAFKGQHNTQVPLVWQHGHTDPENVLGHAILENRPDGVYAYGFFNNSKKAEHARELLVHKDIKMMSIWANDLIERSKMVLHGVIRELSLVLSGANPGALIENVTIRHSDGDESTIPDEAIIYTGIPFDKIGELVHSSTDTTQSTETKDDKTDAEKEELGHANGSTSSSDKTVQDVYDSMTDEQKHVLHYMIGEALASAGSGPVKQDSMNDSASDEKKGTEMRHNVFDQTKEEKKEPFVLSHDDMKSILVDAKATGSLKDAVDNYALAHGIENIDILFPDAQTLDRVPEFLQRRTEWVGSFLGATRKSPFSRIKTVNADITLEEARAKGYVKGNLKKEEFFTVSKRVTTPTTIYKKQKLDRDDMVDITDFDVVAWLKAEMRLMLDEEIARAALIGDGRNFAAEDKINEQNIRPISKDHELYVTTVTVNLDDSNSSISEFVDAVIESRHTFKGSGLPVMYTTETLLAKFLLLKDTLGRRIYKNVDEVATELRVSTIVPVEVMEEEPTILAIFVNPIDYVFGATRGGEVNLFDDFDIDYNQYKYLIETRLCGCLTKLKSAIVVKRATSDHVAVTPNDPTFVPATGVVTIVATTGVVYKNADTDEVMSTGAQTAIDEGETVNVRAEAADGYFIPSTEDAYWSFTHIG